MVEDLPALPSVFTPIIALREGGDALRHACTLAPEKGAGTLVWVRSWARAEAAIVLEPEEALPAARLALHAASVALADALGAYGPPDIPLIFDWPARLRLNGALVGQTRLGLPADTPPDGVPPWLVVGMELRFAEYADGEPGDKPDRTSLLAEGYDDLTPALLVAAWARHFMATVADWQARGFNAAMRVRNAVWRPPFVMYYLTFLLPRAKALLESVGFRVEVHRGLLPAPYERHVLVVATLAG